MPSSLPPTHREIDKDTASNIVYFTQIISLRNFSWPIVVINFLVFIFNIKVGFFVYIAVNAFRQSIDTCIEKVRTFSLILGVH